MSVPTDYFAEQLLRKIDEALAPVTGHVALGMAPDYAAYKYQCGRIKGMNEARQIAKDLIDALVEGKEKESA